ncbi:CPBP family intramembrane glutamic endopeptidase [Nocardia sp. NPDC056064]|uniref:CPBP family intramembrane glutamic endopeptidase n=1 Tax=Nocardia sp. NPDC056064 TaxID=3345701 RepID=UPI0035DA276F
MRTLDTGGSPTAASIRAAVGVYLLATLVASMFFLAVQPHSGIHPAALSLVQFAPAVGALVTWLLFRRTVSGSRPTAVPSRRVGLRVVAMVVVCVGFGLLITVAAAVSGIAPVGTAAVGGVPFAVFVLLQLLGAAGEEIGWRGLLQPLLESRTTNLAAITITGATWALWHVQAFTSDPATACYFTLSTMSFALVLGTLTIGTLGQRVLIATTGHWLINIACYLLAGDNTLHHPQLPVITLAALLTATAVATYPLARRRIRSHRPLAQTSRP